MAEISQGGAGKNAGGKVRAKKHSLKIDMTPMVDLAFLLLTFFILTTTFKEVRVLPLPMPEESTDPAPISAKKVLNLVLAEDNKVYWWTGLDASATLTNYSKNGVREILLKQSQAVPGLMVLIKPMDNSRYENMVDILDEINITGISRYAIVDVTDDDKSSVTEKGIALR